MALFAPRTRLIQDPAFTQRVAGLLIDRLRDVKRDAFPQALWIGGGGAADLKLFKTIETLGIRASAVEGAIERFPFPEASLDLVVVNGLLHTMNDLPGVLIQMRRALKPDGLFLCALAGGETLFELRDSQMRVETQMRGSAAPRVHPMIDLQTMAGLMQRAGFALPVVDSEIKTIFYRQLRTLLRDVKHVGEGMLLADRPCYAGEKLWAAIEADYLKHHADAEGLLKATIEIIFAIGWGPADTQQKPLRPGSAQNRLAEALGTTEHPLKH